MTSLCPVCKVRVSHRRQSLDEHKAQKHPGEKGLSTHTTPSTPKATSSKSKAASKPSGRGAALKRKAEEALSSPSPQKTKVQTKRAKASPAPAPAWPPLTMKTTTQVLPTSVPKPPPLAIPKAPSFVLPPLHAKQTSGSSMIDLSTEETNDNNLKIKIPTPPPAVVEKVTQSSAICPVCSKPIGSTNELVINQHIDECLSLSFLEEESKQQTSFSRDSRDTEYHRPAPTAVRINPPAPSTTTTTPTTTLPPRPATTPNTTRTLETMRAFDRLLEQSIAKIQAPTAAALTTPAATFATRPAKANVVTPVVPPATVVEAGQQSRRSVILEKKLVDKECSICFEEFLAGADVRWLECLCVYHTECIRSWFTKSGKRACPLHPDT